MKRPFSLRDRRATAGVVAGAGLIAATYGLVRLAYGLFLPDVQAELSLGSAAAGLISSGASVIYCGGAIAGFFVATHHPRSLVIAAALSASVGAAGMALSQSAAIFAVFAIVSSAGAGLASPGLVTIVRRNVTDAATDRSQATVNAGTGPGLVAAGMLALVLLPDWRLAWMLVAVFTVLIAGAVLMLDRGAPVGTSSEPRIPPGSWFRSHALVLGAALLLGAGSAAVWNFGRSHLVAAGATEGISVGAWVALGLGGTAVIATARSMSALPPRTAWTVTSLAIAAASATLGLAPNVTILALAACVIFGWGYTAATGALIAWTTRIDGARAAAGTSLLFVVLVFGQALGAAALGAVVEAVDFVAAFLAATLLILGATAVALRSRGH